MSAQKYKITLEQLRMAAVCDTFVTRRDGVMDDSFHRDWNFNRRSVIILSNSLTILVRFCFVALKI
jgi:hypothetical protein